MGKEKLQKQTKLKAAKAEGEGGTRVGVEGGGGARVKGPLKRRHLWHSKSFRWGIVRSGCHLPHVEWREIVSQLSSAGGRLSSRGHG